MPYQLIWGGFRTHLAVHPPDRPTSLLQVTSYGACKNCMFAMKDRLSLERMALSDRVSVAHFGVHAGDGAIIFAPVGELVPLALAAIAPGGTVVCGGIHMSDIPSFPYRLLWEERVIRSVANLTRRDGNELLSLAPGFGLRPHVVRYRLEEVNQALDDLRAGRFDGTAVLAIR